MERIHILTGHQNLSIILSNILEILGFLPIIVDEVIIIAKKEKAEKKIIFTDYYYSKQQTEYLKQFKTVIVFVPYGTTFLEANLKTSSEVNNKVIYFSNNLTVNNIKSILENLKQ